MAIEDAGIDKKNIELCKTLGIEPEGITKITITASALGPWDIQINKIPNISQMDFIISGCGKADA